MIRNRNEITLLLLSGSILLAGSLRALDSRRRAPKAPSSGPLRTDTLGDPLPAGVGARIGSLRGRIGEASSRIIFSPDGRFVIATSEQVKMPLRLWDPETGRLIRVLNELDPLKFVQHAAFSNDSTLIATSDVTGTIRVGSTETGRKIRELVGCEEVNAIVFSPNGKRVHAAEGACILWTWDVATGQVMRCLLLESSAIAFSPAGKYIAIAQPGRTMSVRELTSWKGASPIRDSRKAERPLAFSPDGKRLASTGRKRTVQVWDIATGRLLGRHPDLRTPVGLIIENLEDQVAFSPDGKFLAAGETLSTLAIWDVETGRRLRWFHGIEPEHGFSFAPDGKTLVSGGSHFRFWDIARGLENHRLPALGIIDSVAFQPDGKAIATANGDELRLWDIGSCRELRRMRGPSNSIRSVAYSPDGKVLASSGAGGSLRLWDAQKGGEIRSVPGLSGFVWQVAFSPDGKFFAAVDEHGAGVWNLATAKEIPRFSKLPEATFNQVCFTADGKTLALGGSDGIFVWEVETDRELKRTSGSPFALALARDGKTLAWDTDSGGLCLWKWKEGTFIHVAPGRTSDDGQLHFPAVAFSPDGKTLALTGQDNFVTLRDAATVNARKILVGHEAVVTSLAFSPDGKTIASGSVDGTVLIWDTGN